MDIRDAERVAWRGWDNRQGRPSRWSKQHRSVDSGRTALCGAVAPAVFYDADDYGNGNQCKRCKALYAAATK